MKYLPSILSFAVLIAGAVSGNFQDYVSHHAALSAVLAGVYSIFSHLLPSPLKAS